MTKNKHTATENQYMERSMPTFRCAPLVEVRPENGVDVGEGVSEDTVVVTAPVAVLPLVPLLLLIVETGGVVVEADFVVVVVGTCVLPCFFIMSTAAQMLFVVDCVLRYCN